MADDEDDFPPFWDKTTIAIVSCMALFIGGAFYALVHFGVQ